MARLGLYAGAGYDGAGSFCVRLGLTLDQAWERELIFEFVRACYVSQSGRDDPVSRAETLVPASLEPLCSGSLTVRYVAATARKWSAVWEFRYEGDPYHVSLVGDRTGWLASGDVPDMASTVGSRPIVDWLNETHPRTGPVPLEFSASLARLDQPVTFSVSSTNDRPRVPESVLRLSELLGIDHENRGFSFDQLLSVVLQRGVVLTENRRLPLRRVFAVSELGRAGELRDGSAVPGELFRLKLGGAGEQARFAEIQEMFSVLTGRKLEVRARPATQDEGDGLVIEPTVAGRHGQRLAELSGAGIQEALVLSTLLGDAPGMVTVLDEPAVNLEPTVQRRLVGRIRGPGQFLVITHNADLVPFEGADDLRRIVRVAQGDAGSVVYQPRFDEADGKEQLKRLQLLEPTEVRGLLFAAGVVLCEGGTETAALPRWWRDGVARSGLPDPGAANVAVVSVDGDKNFGISLRFLEAFGVPWAVVADGPALRRQSKLADDLRGIGRWPGGPEPERDDFAGWRAWWEQAGVFTVASQFGDDGSKSGEFEAFLASVDADLLADAERAAGGSKPRTGAYFSIERPAAPAEVVKLYRKVAARLGFGGRNEA